jgi:hypothetical protein
MMLTETFDFLFLMQLLEKQMKSTGQIMAILSLVRQVT